MATCLNSGKSTPLRIFMSVGKAENCKTFMQHNKVKETFLRYNRNLHPLICIYRKFYSKISLFNPKVCRGRAMRPYTHVYRRVCVEIKRRIGSRIGKKQFCSVESNNYHLRWPFCFYLENFRNSANFVFYPGSASSRFISFNVASFPSRVKKIRC